MILPSRANTAFIFMMKNAFDFLVHFRLWIALCARANSSAVTIAENVRGVIDHWSEGTLLVGVPSFFEVFPYIEVPIYFSFLRIRRTDS